MNLLQKLKNLKLNDNNIVIIGNINSKNNIYLRDIKERNNNSLIINRHHGREDSFVKKDPMNKPRESLSKRNYSIEKMISS